MRANLLAIVLLATALSPLLAGCGRIAIDAIGGDPGGYGPPPSPFPVEQPRDLTAVVGVDLYPATPFPGGGTGPGSSTN